MPKLVSRADLLTAHRAILYATGLTPGEKAVGCAIVSHYNEDTGQCDPSASRLAKLIGVKRDTVFNAVAGLEKLGVLVRRTYGGKAHRNSYSIDWQRCADLDRAANRPHRGTVKALRQQSPDGDGEPSPDGDTNVLLVKRSIEPTDRGLGSEKRHKGLSRQEPASRQLHLTHTIAGGKGAGQKAAEGGAQRRVGKAIAALPDARQREAAWLAEMERADADRVLPARNDAVYSNPTTTLEDGGLEPKFGGLR